MPGFPCVSSERGPCHCPGGARHLGHFLLFRQVSDMPPAVGSQHGGWAASQEAPQPIRWALIEHTQRHMHHLIMLNVEFSGIK